MLDDHAYGLSKRRVTISTSGIVPAIDRLGERLPISLAISLHASNDALRNELVPINVKYPLDELMAACDRYAEVVPHGAIIYEYVMIQDVNDTPEHADELIELLGPRKEAVKINLIPFNEWPGASYRRSSNNRIRAFADIIYKAGYASPIRTPRGEDIMAACGQLKSDTERVRKSRAQIATEAGI
jgi:23S rRNA (adenine2503-C2)-methyltransferase